jgi:hypothetical protein
MRRGEWKRGDVASTSTPLLACRGCPARGDRVDVDEHEPGSEKASPDGRAPMGRTLDPPVGGAARDAHLAREVDERPAKAKVRPERSPS